MPNADAKGTSAAWPASAAAFSTAAQPPSTIASASDTALQRGDGLSHRLQDAVQFGPHRPGHADRSADQNLGPGQYLAEQGTGVVGEAMMRRESRPVDRLADELGRRVAQDLSPLPDMALKAELAPIRDAADRLMARLALALEAERSFSSNAAHELRTPIAATLPPTQRPPEEAPSGPLRDRARRVEAELKRMTRLAEKLLQLARAEGSGVIASEPHDQVPILTALVHDLARDLPPDRVVLSLPDRPLMSHLDADTFAVLARNLIENGLTHGAADSPVVVTLDRDGTLSVANDGPVVAPDKLAQLTTRFERAGSRKAGSGLGLTIVASIAAAMGRDLEVSSPRPGSRTGFLVGVNVRAGQ